MPELTTFLWYDNEAEEAARFYTSLFDDGEVLRVRHYGSAGPREAGTVMEVEFRLAGQTVLALNGGDSYRFNESVSLMIHCDT
jgi:predicted 3-demethylubiquinone-9 3-methyltransferase (glyoxalase superfamily)